MGFSAASLLDGDGSSYECQHRDDSDDRIQNRELPGRRFAVNDFYVTVKRVARHLESFGGLYVDRVLIGVRIYDCIWSEYNLRGILYDDFLQ